MYRQNYNFPQDLIQNPILTCGGYRSSVHSIQAVSPGIMTLALPLKPEKTSEVLLDNKTNHFSANLCSLTTTMLFTFHYFVNYATNSTAVLPEEHHNQAKLYVRAYK